MSQRTSLTNDDLMAALKRQINFLLRAAWFFDTQGIEHEEEAVHMATNLRVLCHDGGKGSNSQGLLQQLDRAGLITLNALRFNDTSAPSPPQPVLAPGQVVVGRTFDPGLIGVANLGTGPRWSPVFDERGRNFTLPFTQWWDDQFITTLGVDFFSRGSLVKTMADQDGGAHVDPAVETTYRTYYKGDEAMKIAPAPPDGRLPQSFPLADIASPSGSPAFATVRQIAHEMLTTLGDQVAGPLGLTLQVPPFAPFGPVTTQPVFMLIGTPAPPEQQ